MASSGFNLLVNSSVIRMPFEKLMFFYENANKIVKYW